MLRSRADVGRLESSSPPNKSVTGAGLGPDSLSCSIDSWLRHPNAILNATTSLAIDQNQVTDLEKGDRRMLARDEIFGFRAAYWPELHELLYEGLRIDVDVLWGHLFVSFSILDGEGVKVRAKVVKSGDEVEFAADLLVGADGCLSSIGQNFLPEVKLMFVV